MPFCCTQVFAGISDIQFNKTFNKGQFILPGAEELRLLNNAYQQELLDKPTEGLWNALAMQSRLQQDVLYIKEADNSQTGRGLFALNKSTKVKPWLLQAPHAKSDLYTGKIVAKLFDEGGIKAAMWNTVPRKTHIENTVGRRTADMAHLSGTYWQTVTEGFARHYADSKVIQFHGYAQSKRKSVAAKNSDMIISAGHRNPPLWVQQLALCIQKSLPGKISLYPYDVKELGATTNVQGHLLRRLGFDGFVHIEMGKSMRQRLLESQKLRSLLLACF